MTDAADPSRGGRQGHLAMLAFSALVAGSFSLGAQVANDIAPAALNAVRFVISAVAVAAAIGLRGGFGAVPGALVAPWRYGILGVLFAVYFVTMFEGLKTAPAVSTAAVFTLTPVMSGIFGYLLLRQMMTARIWLALALGAAGALWVIFRADWRAALALDVGRGEAVYFLGCVAHAIYTPVVRRLNRGEPAVVFSLGMMLAGGAILTVWGWPAIMATDWAALPAIVWVTLVYIAVAASAMTFVLLQYATLRLPSAKVMAYTYLVPSWVILWELALHRSAPPGLVSVGVAMTAVALLLLIKDESRAGA